MTTTCNIQSKQAFKTLKNKDLRAKTHIYPSIEPDTIKSCSNSGFKIDLLHQNQQSASITVKLYENCTASVLGPFSNGMIICKIKQGNSSHHWQLRLIPDHHAGVWHLLETGKLDNGKMTLTLPGETFHTHQQLTRINLPSDQASGRIGCFTQHGQLFDFKDWFAVSTGQQVTAVICPRPGHWTYPAQTVGQITGQPNSVTLSLPFTSNARYHRNLLIAHTSLDQLTHNDCLGMEGYEQDPTVGHTSWAPQTIARYGFAHPKRLAEIDSKVRQINWQRPTQPAICTMNQLTQARQNVLDNSTLAHDNPYWAGQHQQAATLCLEWLADALDALKDKAHLHPKGNPVYLRPLAPLMTMYNLLDVDGHLTDEQRTDGASLIAQLATLLIRRDFYPWDAAMLPTDDPRSIESLYRGMLNQNFNTDRYVAVGMAGCVLGDHPHASRWRKHAIAQFKWQMKSFVYPQGCWEESHTYANHVKLTLLPLGLALRQSEQAFDMFANENFAAMCQFFVPLLSPKQVDLGNRRAIPAIGDHGYTHADYSLLFGWLSSVFPEESGEYAWAWEQTGSGLAHADSLQQTMFHPLLAPSQSASSKAIDPPKLKAYPGYGACARFGFGTDDESMLLVRCGEAWGHYHPDLGSFWWWSDNELICADAQLGQGAMKLEHQGHNVLGYVDHRPMLHLDRTAFAITQAQQISDEQCHITCVIPVERWYGKKDRIIDIPAEDQPTNTRQFRWHGADALDILDTPHQSPQKQVTWTLHVLADDIKQVAPDRFVFTLTQSSRHMTLLCPCVPKQTIEHRHAPTLGLTLIYPEQPLKHQLRIERNNL